jgi:hypothetical protein
MKFNGQLLSKMVLYVIDGQQNRAKKILRLIKNRMSFTALRFSSQAIAISAKNKNLRRRKVS